MTKTLIDTSREWLEVRKRTLLDAIAQHPEYRECMAVELSRIRAAIRFHKIGNFEFAEHKNNGEELE